MLDDSQEKICKKISELELNNSQMEIAIVRESLIMSLSSFKLAHKFIDQIGNVDVVSESKIIKKLLKMPYSSSYISVMIHNINDSMLLEDFDVNHINLELWKTYNNLFGLNNEYVFCWFMLHHFVTNNFGSIYEKECFNDVEELNFKKILMRYLYLSFLNKSPNTFSKCISSNDDVSALNNEIPTTYDFWENRASLDKFIGHLYGSLKYLCPSNFDYSSKVYDIIKLKTLLLSDFNVEPYEREFIKFLLNEEINKDPVPKLEKIDSQYIGLLSLPWFESSLDNCDSKLKNIVMPNQILTPSIEDNIYSNNLQINIKIEEDYQMPSKSSRQNELFTPVKNTAGGDVWELPKDYIWNFEDLRMLINSDLPIFGGGKYPAISLRLKDMSEDHGINVLTGIDYWLDNLMCNVPELVMCYHLDGVIQKYEMIKTNEIPEKTFDCFDKTNNPRQQENSDEKPKGEKGKATTKTFDPGLIRDLARNLLAFIKSKCTRQGHTYWLFRGPGDEIVKLYDLTSLLRLFNQTAPSNQAHSPSDIFDFVATSLNDAPFIGQFECPLLDRMKPSICKRRANGSNTTFEDSTALMTKSNELALVCRRNMDSPLIDIPFQNPYSFPVALLLYKMAYNIKCKILDPFARRSSSRTSECRFSNKFQTSVNLQADDYKDFSSACSSYESLLVKCRALLFDILQSHGYVNLFYEEVKRKSTANPSKSLIKQVKQYRLRLREDLNELLKTCEKTTKPDISTSNFISVTLNAARLFILVSELLTEHIVYAQIENVYELAEQQERYHGLESQHESKRSPQPLEPTNKTQCLLPPTERSNLLSSSKIQISSKKSIKNHLNYCDNTSSLQPTSSISLKKLTSTPKATHSKNIDCVNTANNNLKNSIHNVTDKHLLDGSNLTCSLKQPEQSEISAEVSKSKKKRLKKQSKMYKEHRNDNDDNCFAVNNKNHLGTYDGQLKLRNEINLLPRLEQAFQILIEVFNCMESLIARHPECLTTDKLVLVAKAHLFGKMVIIQAFSSILAMNCNEFEIAQQFIEMIVLIQEIFELVVYHSLDKGDALLFDHNPITLYNLVLELRADYYIRASEFKKHAASQNVHNKSSAGYTSYLLNLLAYKDYLKRQAHLFKNQYEIYYYTHKSHKYNHTPAQKFNSEGCNDKIEWDDHRGRRSEDEIKVIDSLDVCLKAYQTCLQDQDTLQSAIKNRIQTKIASCYNEIGNCHKNKCVLLFEQLNGVLIETNNEGYELSLQTNEQKENCNELKTKYTAQLEQLCQLHLTCVESYDQTIKQFTSLLDFDAALAASCPAHQHKRTYKERSVVHGQNDCKCTSFNTEENYESNLHSQLNYMINLALVSLNKAKIHVFACEILKLIQQYELRYHKIVQCFNQSHYKSYSAQSTEMNFMEAIETCGGAMQIIDQKIKSKHFRPFKISTRNVGSSLTHHLFNTLIDLREELEKLCKTCYLQTARICLDHGTPVSECFYNLNNINQEKNGNDGSNDENTHVTNNKNNNFLVKNVDMAIDILEKGGRDFPTDPRFCHELGSAYFSRLILTQNTEQQSLVNSSIPQKDNLVDHNYVTNNALKRSKKKKNAGNSVFEKVGKSEIKESTINGTNYKIRKSLISHGEYMIESTKSHAYQPFPHSTKLLYLANLNMDKAVDLYLEKIDSLEHHVLTAQYLTNAFEVEIQRLTFFAQLANIPINSPTHQTIIPKDERNSISKQHLRSMIFIMLNSIVPILQNVLRYSSYQDSENLTTIDYDSFRSLMNLILNITHELSYLNPITRDHDFIKKINILSQPSHLASLKNQEQLAVVLLDVITAFESFLELI